MPNKNLAYSLVATAPSPASSGTSLVVTAADGANFPAAAAGGGRFWVTLAPPDVIPTIANSEIVEVTSRSTDTFTIVRAQRGTTAKSVAIGWQVFQGIYIEDINSAWLQSQVFN